MRDHELVNNIRKFWLLQTIVDCGNFREAAARARVTQSALSQTVSHLEALTGRVLLQRQKGYVEATAHCRELLQRVQPVLSAVAQVTREIDEAPPMAWLTFGSYESFAVDFVPELITRLQLKCPGLRFSLRVARSGALATLVRKGELCMALLREIDEMGRLDVLPITSDRVGFWAVPTHPAVEQGWGALAEHEIGTLAPEGDGHPRYLRRLIEAANLTRRPMFVSDSYQSLMSAALSGALVSVLPERQVLAANAKLIEIRHPDAASTLGTHDIFLVSRQGCDPRENEFLANELREIIAERGVAACSGSMCCEPAAAAHA